jgi:hypothetical protein
MRPVLLLIVAGCLPLGCCHTYHAPGSAEHVVRAPISERGNAVLENLILEYGYADGAWGGCMSAGCAPIWATQFGFRAGTRRNRRDLIDLAKRSAAWQSSLVKDMAFEEIFGGRSVDREAAMSGFPTLLLSASMGKRGFDGFMFGMGIDRLESGAAGPLGPRESAGAAALLAETARADPAAAEEHLAKARELANTVSDEGGGTWAALAWAAIARSSGEGDDLARARMFVATTEFHFDPETGAVANPAVEGKPILSRYLSLCHALADLAQVTGDPVVHRSAMTLIDQIFSDTWFDGRFIAHDLQAGGTKSEDVCSGCNFMALYLLDRLYGDTFVIDPLPALPQREFEPKDGGLRKAQTEFFLDEGQERGSVSLATLPLEGRFGFRHATKPLAMVVEFAILIDWAWPPNGGLRIRGEREEDGERSEFGMTGGFDDKGVARLTFGSEPLIVHFTVHRTSEGPYRAEVELIQDAPDQTPQEK